MDKRSSKRAFTCRFSARLLLGRRRVESEEEEEEEEADDGARVKGIVRDRERRLPREMGRGETISVPIPGGML